MANSLDIRSGTITRQRIFDNKMEKSVIDYLIVCQKMKNMLINISIDEEQNYSLTRYDKRNRQRLIKSDHNTFFASFDIPHNFQTKKKADVFFNFKDIEARRKFEIEMKSSNALSNCFRGNNFLCNANAFFKVLNKKLHKCFKKIQIKRRPHEGYMHGNPTIQKLLKEKDKLHKRLKTGTLNRDEFEKHKNEKEESINKEMNRINKEKVTKYIDEI